MKIFNLLKFFFSSHLLVRFVELKNDLNFKNNIEKKIKKKKIIWIFCTPKTASTFFSKYISYQVLKNNIKARTIRAVDEFGTRPQAISKHKIYNSLLPNFFNLTYITYRQHSICTSDLESVISKNHKVVIIYRGFFDTIASLKDYWDKIPSSIWTPSLSYDYKKRNFKSKIDMIIDVYLIWHIQFMKSWLKYSRKSKNVIFLHYNDVTKDTFECFTKIFDRNKTKLKEYSFNFKKKDILFNKGYSRHKKYISLSQKKKIIDIIKKYDNPKDNLLSYLL